MVYPTCPRRRGNRLRSWRNALMTAMLLSAHFINGLAYVEPAVPYAAEKVRAYNASTAVAVAALLPGRRVQTALMSSTPSALLMLPTPAAFFSPMFDPGMPNNISTQVGAHAFLPCKIRHLSNKSVSWIRRRDAHILTVDRFTFIADERFQSFLVKQADAWSVLNNLEVKFVQQRDNGMYECQVGTEPKMSHYVNLHVATPKIEIIGQPEMHVKSGSEVQLRCIVTASFAPPNYIFWFHKGRRVLDERVAILQLSAKDAEPLGYDSVITVAQVMMKPVTRSDSGNWTCAPSNLKTANIILHVLTAAGEHPAAMQHGSASPPRPPLYAAVAAGVLLCNDSLGQRLVNIVKVTLVFFVATIFCHDEDDN